MVSDFEVTEYGLMSPLLEVSVLSDLCVSDGGVQTGPFGSLLHKKDYVDQGTPIITVEHLGENRIIHSNTPYVSDADKERLSKYSLQTGDIVFSRVGSVDRRSLVRDEEDGWLFSGRCLRVRANKQLIDPAYLSYFFGFEGFKNHIRGIAVGATMPSINTKILSDIRIFYPKLEEQKAIAHILGTLDDKIELNRQMNETLEAMAQALFKSWFVDFDPVIDNALLAGKAIPEPLKERAEMRQAQLDSGKANTDSEINDLFPSEFEFTEKLGWIPKGWEVARLDEMFQLQRGFDLPKKKRTDGSYPLMAASGQDGTHNEFKVEGPGVVTGRSGKLGIVSFVQSDFWPLNTTLWLKNYNYSNPYHAYFFLKTLDLENYNSGSAVPSLNRNNVHNLQQVISPKSVLNKFKDLVRSNFDKIDLNNSQSITLSELRDTLLPKLMSGELRIADAEKMVADI